MTEGLRTIYLKLTSIKLFEGEDPRVSKEQHAENYRDAILRGIPLNNINDVEVTDVRDSYREIDEFEAAGFSEEICEMCRDIQMKNGISSESLIALLRSFDNQKTK